MSLKKMLNCAQAVRMESTLPSINIVVMSDVKMSLLMSKNLKLKWQKRGLKEMCYPGA